MRSVSVIKFSYKNLPYDSKMTVHDIKYTKLLDEFKKLFEFLFTYDFNTSKPLEIMISS